MNDMGTKPTGVVGAENGRVVHGIHVALYEFSMPSLDSELTILNETGLKCALMLFMQNPIKAISFQHQLKAPSGCP